jgi:tetratricopeptide (TPR) repeat protein
MEEPKIFGEIALKKFLHDNKISEKLEKFEFLTTNKFTLFRENQINEIGYELIELNRYFDALKIFELNIIKFPNSANAFDSYAEVCLLIHDTTSAINNYQKALDIDPLYANSEYAKLIINQLKK